VDGQRHAPAALFPGKRPGTHCIVGWVDPRAEYLAPNEIRSADRPARSKLLYRLRYPVPPSDVYGTSKCFECLLYIIPFHLCFLYRFSTNAQIWSLMQICPEEAQLFHAHGWRDTTKLAVAFRNFPNAPTNGKNTRTISFRPFITMVTLQCCIKTYIILVYLLLKSTFRTNWTISRQTGGTSCQAPQQATQTSSFQSLDYMRLRGMGWDRMGWGGVHHRDLKST